MLVAETPFSFLTVILGVLVAGGLIALIIFLNWTDRNRVRRLIESDGSRIVALYPREGPIWVRILNQQSITHWDVYYFSREGEKRKAVCTAMLLRCFIESDEPFVEEQPSERK